MRVKCLLFVWVLSVAASPTAMASTTLLIVGDSLSSEYRLPAGSGWVALLQERLRKDFRDIRVVNESVSGETARGALARLPTLLRQHQPSVVLLEIGGNDGLRGMQPDTIEKNVRDMVTLSQEKAVVLLTQMRIPLNYGARYTQQFEQLYRDIASETDAILLPFLLEDVATDPNLMQADRIHPTVAAQARILETLYPGIKSVLEALNN